MITFKHSGNFNNTERFFRRTKQILDKSAAILNRCGKEGVSALKAATPIDSGITADSWDYEITTSRTFCKITWTNSHVVNNIPIAVIIQYGHGTGTGGYVQGRDYINPAMRPIFDKIAQDIWAEVIR
jgi:hypothetical protein